MADSDFEIEYLEEDEDIVQKCVETQHAYEERLVIIKPPKAFGQERVVSPSSLLVERICLQQEEKARAGNHPWKSRARDDEDSDYQPTEEEDDSDYDPDLHEFDRKQKKSKKSKTSNRPIHQQHSVFIRQPQVKAHVYERVVPKNISTKTPQLSVKYPGSMQRTMAPTNQGSNKTIQSAKYESVFDTLLMDKTPSREMTKRTNISAKSPVTQTIVKAKPSSLRSVRKQYFDNARATGGEPFKLFLKDVYLCDYEDPKYFQNATLKSHESIRDQWNELCRQRSMRFERKPLPKVARTTQFLRKINVKINDKQESIIKLHVDQKILDKCDSFQAFLPQFKSNLTNLEFKQPNESKKGLKELESVTILSKETQKDTNVLVAYSPTEFRSTTYEMVQNGEINGRSVKRYLRMMMSCKMCASCYQYSWRGQKDQRGSCEVRCVTCKGVFTSAYNLLTHVRSHKLHALEKSKQNKILSKIMGYHYRCRLCRYQATSIPDLRCHLRLHRCDHKFHCEVGQHITD